MAGSDVIKQKIVLEGEKEYREALKDAARNLKTLKSELKAETAELGRNATEQQKAEAKARSLQKQIKEQEKIVQTYKKALEEVRKNYADDEDAIARWETKLNDARTSLANMKNELEGVGSGMKTLQNDANLATVASKSVADTIGNLAGIGQTVSDSIEGIFTGMLNTIRESIGEIWGLISETAAKANNWTDLAGIYGSTPEYVQMMYHTMNSVGGSGKFDQFMGLAQKIIMGDSKKIAAAFGVSKENYEDDLQYAWAVLDAMSGYKRGHTQNEWDSALEGAGFKKKSEDIGWFAANWFGERGILSAREKYQETGGAMDSETLATMNEVQLVVNDITDKWDRLKEKVGGGLGSASLEILTNVSGGLDALLKYFDAETPEEREAALKELEDNILEAFRRIKKAIEDGIALLDQIATDLKESDDPVAQSIGNILGNIVEALKWFTADNMQNVVTALEILAGFWIAGKGLALVAKVAEFAKNITLLKNAGVLSSIFGGGGSAGTALAGGASTGASTAATTAGGGLMTKLAGAIASPAGFLVLSAAGTFAFGQYMTNKTYEEQWGEFNRNSAEQEGREDVPQILRDFHDAAFGVNDGVNAETGDYEDRMELSKDLFMQFGGLLYQLDPNNQFWRNGIVQEYLEDGILTNEELKDLVEHAEDYGILSDDWERLFVDMYNLMSDKWKNGDAEGIPADWWQTAGADENGVTKQDLAAFNSLPDKMRQEVGKAISNVKVTLDGYTVGQLLAPYISQSIASAINSLEV